MSLPLGFDKPNFRFSWNMANFHLALLVSDHGSNRIKYDIRSKQLGFNPICTQTQ